MDRKGQKENAQKADGAMIEVLTGKINHEE